MNNQMLASTSISASAADSGAVTQLQNLPRKIQWPSGKTALKQNFSLPSSIIYYIAMNPSTPEVYNKLIQTCKFFFERNLILVAANIYDENTKLCPRKACSGYNDKCCVKFDLNKTTSKIWLTNGLYFCSNRKPLIRIAFNQLFFTKIYQFEIDEIVLLQVNIMFEDFEYLASSANTVNLQKVRMTYANGDLAMLEDVLEVITNAEKFEWGFDTTVLNSTSSPVKNIPELNNVPFLQYLILRNISDIFNIDALLTFIQNYNDMEFLFVFDDNISFEYRAQLDDLVDTVIECANLKCIIKYLGQDYEKLEIMNERCFW